ncbi:MAG TPA: zinc ABC transporter substrate-binding protein [Alphaproteobacteria bacterium]|nr:zinc ABC transporter substrate-binding protein [Alphaproteobacteria bacterium]
MIRAPLIAALFSAALLTGTAVQAEPPKVLATIKPLHALASTVMEGVGRPDLLLRANSSAHTYSLRPSDAQAIQRAGLIFWIGPGYEAFMAKAIKALPQAGKAVQMSAAPGVALLPTREGGVWEDDDHGHAGHSHAGQDADDDEHDMHLWLDPENAKAIVAAMSAALAKADPANAARYDANARASAAAIDALDAQLAAKLAPLKDKPFIVFHDAYQYYEKRYGLSAVGSITVTPDRVPGPRRLSELRKKIADQGALCVFNEPQFTSGLVGTVLSSTKARAGTLDPLGAKAPDGAAGYAGLMTDLALGLSDCLLGSR